MPRMQRTAVPIGYANPRDAGARDRAFAVLRRFSAQKGEGSTLLRPWRSETPSCMRGVVTSCADWTPWGSTSAVPSSRTPRRATWSGCRWKTSAARDVSSHTSKLEFRRDGGSALMQQMHVYGVSFDLVGKQPIVLLKTMEGNRFLPIWIGHSEAAAILMKLQNAAPPRPMTHDLVTDMLSQLDVSIVQVAVTELRENTFFAQVTIRQDGSELEIDSRPSDAIALAVRTDAPIFVADDVIDENAIEFEHDEEVDSAELEKEVSRFRSFLENVTPEDFTGDAEDDV